MPDKEKGINWSNSPILNVQIPVENQLAISSSSLRSNTIFRHPKKAGEEAEKWQRNHNMELIRYGR